MVSKCLQTSEWVRSVNHVGFITRGRGFSRAFDTSSKGFYKNFQKVFLMGMVLGCPMGQYRTFGGFAGRWTTIIYKFSGQLG